jgi:hypothetical protein
VTLRNSACRLRRTSYLRQPMKKTNCKAPDFQTFPSSARSYLLDVPGFSLGGQLYRLIGRRSFERERGHPLVILVWETNCPSCGRLFHLATRRTSSTIKRRCDNCRRPGYRVADELRARGNISRPTPGP